MPTAPIQHLRGGCAADAVDKINEVVDLVNKMVAIGQANNTGPRLDALEASQKAQDDAIKGVQGALAQLGKAPAAAPAAQA